MDRKKSLKLILFMLTMLLGLSWSVLAKPDEELLHMAFICGSPIFTVNGVQKSLVEGDDSVVPYLQDGRLMVPLRAFAENFEMEVQWDVEEPDKVGLSIGELHIDVETVASTAMCRIRNQYLSKREVVVSPSIKRNDGVTFVPVRALCDLLGLDIFWNDDLKQALVKERSDAQLYHMECSVKIDDGNVTIEITEYNHSDWDVRISGRDYYRAVLPAIFDRDGVNMDMMLPTKNTNRAEGAGDRIFQLPKNGELTYTNHKWLPPGKYTLGYGTDFSAKPLIMYGYREVQRPPSDMEPVTFEVPEK